MEKKKRTVQTAMPPSLNKREKNDKCLQESEKNLNFAF